MDCSMLGFPVLHHLPELAQTLVYWVWWCHPTISSSCPLFVLPSIFPSVRVFSNDTALHIRWPKHWHFSFSISTSNEYSGLISFRIDLFDLLAVQGTLKILLQYQFKSINFSALSLLYSPTLTSIHDYRKNLGLTIRTFIGKVISVLFNTLSSFVIAFLPRSKRLLISWLKSPSTVILEPKKMKSFTVSIVPHLYTMKWWDQMPWSSFFKFWVLSQLFHSPLLTSSRGSLVPLHFLPLKWCHLHIWGY